MDNYLREKKAKDTEKGVKSELSFVELIMRLNCRVQKATKEQNMLEHWDYMIIMSGSTGIVVNRVDVKSDKDGHANGFTWIEYKNILGKDGWILSPYMDTLAFERTDCYEFVNREKLKEFVDKKIEEALIEDGEKILYCNKDGLKYYRQYRRGGNDDLIYKVPFSDFDDLIYVRLYKDGRYERYN